MKSRAVLVAQRGHGDAEPNLQVASRFSLLFLRVVAPLRERAQRVVVALQVASPSAMYCPSFVQAHALMRATDLYFWTAFCSDDQKEKSDTAHEASWCEIGLNAKH